MPRPRAQKTTTDTAAVETAAPAASWLPQVTRRDLVVFAVWLVVLLGPWPGVGRAFTAFFSGYANLVVALLHLGGAAPPQFAPPTADARHDPEIGDWSVMLSPARPGDGAAAVPLETRVIGYTPLALLLALLLATRVPPRRKLLVLALGGTVLLARLAIGIALPVARLLGSLEQGSALAPVAEVVWWAFIATPASSYAAPLVSWGVALAVTAPRGYAGRPKCYGFTSPEVPTTPSAWRRSSTAAPRSRRRSTRRRGG